MTDQNQSLREDIAFLRGLAEAGQARPMAGASILVAAGVIFGVASLIVWVLNAVRGVTANWLYSAVWGAAFVGYMAFLFLRIRAMPRERSTLQAATGVAWSGLGWAIFFVGASLGVMSWRLQVPNLLFAFPSIIIALYGAGWFIAAALLRKRWLHAVSAGSFAASVVNAWYAGDAAIWLVYSASLFVLMAAPGLVLMREAPARAA